MGRRQVRRSCHVCSERIDRDESELKVALRNGLFVEVCFRCWFIWPDEHKLEQGSPKTDDPFWRLPLTESVSPQKDEQTLPRSEEVAA
jgi:hypothetical protein